MATREQLTASIDEAASLLRRLGQPNWAASLESDRELVAVGDFRGVERLVSTLSAGGAGSLNDLVFPDKKDGWSRNQHLDRLLGTVYEIAIELKREGET